MPKWTQEKKDSMREKVRSILVRKPTASQFELAKILTINRATASKLKAEVERENTERISSQIVNVEVGKMEAEYNQLALECWQIITNETRKVKIIKKNELTKAEELQEVEVSIPIREKISAIRTLIQAKETLFNIKFDAGIFSRKIGEVDLGKKLTTEELDMIKRAINLDYGRPEPKPEPDKPSTTDNAGGTAV